MSHGRPQEDLGELDSSPPRIVLVLPPVADDEQFKCRLDEILDDLPRWQVESLQGCLANKPETACPFSQVVLEQDRIRVEDGVLDLRQREDPPCWEPRV